MQCKRLYFSIEGLVAPGLRGIHPGNSLISPHFFAALLRLAEMQARLLLVLAQVVREILQTVRIL